MDKVKVMSLIWSMGDGGAQQVLINYLRDFKDDPDIDFRVCVYTEPTKSKYDREIEDKNYNVYYLNNPRTKIQIPYFKRFFQRPISKAAWVNYVSDELKQFTWQGLYELIEGRKTNPKEGSYTTYLFDKGLEKILKKVGEESTEVIIAGSKRDKEETVYEISDLAYHVMVLMIELGISVEDITKELEKRHVIDHKVKQERMQ